MNPTVVLILACAGLLLSAVSVTAVIVDRRKRRRT